MSSRRFLIIGAHPDDADILFGGTALKLAGAGHVVKFVSMCNGDCGHFDMDRIKLRDRRYLETQASAKIAGLQEYQVFSENHDCELEPTVEIRKKVTAVIREFKPDVVLSHRLCDYHADHRATAQLVLDCAYLTQVPLFCSESAVPAENPVFGYLFDRFTDPRPQRPDAAVIIDDVMEQKCRMLDCHVSQVYEWLAYEKTGRAMEPEKLSWEERLDYLRSNWGERFKIAADNARELLISSYGEAGRNAVYAETFELSPYGRKITPAEFQALFQP